MTTFDAIFLGLIQGLTEFIPVSSSGHLLIFKFFIASEYQTIKYYSSLIPVFSQTFKQGFCDA